MEERELKGSIYIKPKDIQVLNDCSIRHAQREYQTVKDVLQIIGNKLTVKAYCEYYGIDYELVKKRLNQYR